MSDARRQRRPAAMIAAVALGLIASLGLAAGSAAPAAAETSVLRQCWSPAALIATPAEKPPRKGAEGHRQGIPERSLAPFETVPMHLRGSIRRVTLPKGLKLVALTFDLCEQPGEIAGYDGAIVDYLRREGVRATVFVGGKWLMTHAERAEQLVADPLLELASHGWVHRNVRSLAAPALAAEIDGPQRAYETVRARLGARTCAVKAPSAMQAIPARLGLYRFPYGACDAAGLDALAANGLAAVQWDISPGDASPRQSAAAIARHVLARVKPGSIVLMHANGRGYNTAAALPLLVPALRARGYRMVTVTELLRAGRPEIAPTCYDSRPGDTDRYDRLTSFTTTVRRER